MSKGKKIGLIVLIVVIVAILSYSIIIPLAKRYITPIVIQKKCDSYGEGYEAMYNTGQFTSIPMWICVKNGTAIDPKDGGTINCTGAC